MTGLPRGIRTTSWVKIADGLSLSGSDAVSGVFGSDEWGHVGVFYDLTIGTATSMVFNLQAWDPLQGDWTNLTDANGSTVSQTHTASKQRVNCWGTDAVQAQRLCYYPLEHRAFRFRFVGTPTINTATLDMWACGFVQADGKLHLGTR